MWYIWIWIHPKENGESGRKRFIEFYYWKLEQYQTYFKETDVANLILWFGIWPRSTRKEKGLLKGVR